jgi:hypothetical protein
MSKLAHAGENKTISPGSASLAAVRTALIRSVASTISTPDALNISLD